MEIKKIKLLAGGYKGAEIQWLKPRKQNKVDYTDTIDEERNTPIHSDLDILLKSLRYYLLDICGLIRGDEKKMELDYAIGECEITKVEIESKTFILHGNKSCLKNQSYTFKTPKVDEDGYERYSEVVEILEKIKSEAVLYLDGTKEISPEEIAIRFAHSGRDKEAIDKYEAMTAEEKAVYHQTILENLGFFVMRPEDVVEDNDENHTILNIVPNNTGHENQEIELPTGTNEAF